jgi:hypothetical protein
MSNNRKLESYTDFCNNWQAQKEKLKKVKRSFMPNSDRQNFVRNSRTEYDPITNKLTDYTEEEIEDTLDKMDEIEKESE